MHHPKVSRPQDLARKRESQISISPIKSLYHIISLSLYIYIYIYIYTYMYICRYVYIYIYIYIHTYI